jgi:hypothetical protein
MMELIREEMRPKRRAQRKLFIIKPSISLAVIKIITQLRTSPKIPRVKKFMGKVKSLIMGLMKVLIKVKVRATMRAVTKFLIWTPAKI